jgi:Kef-type K+ transport system membrane component KefB
MGHFFFEITLIVGLASILSIIFRIFKQPSILAYILTGVILGPLGIIQLEGTEVIEFFAEIGITLLLFMLGLELRFSELKSVGKISLLTGIGQIVFTSIIGFAVCTLLGFSPLLSLYLSIALTFSSTIIIVKLLSDKKDLQSLYGKISVGFLLVQDFVAILALILLSGFTTDSSVNIFSFSFIILKAVLLFGLVIFLSRSILPSLMNKIAHSQETLFLFSLAWAFGLSAFIASPFVGFSIEIGGFLAGLALANTSENYQIITRVKPLRDFFITIFFVTLGTGLLFSDISTILIPGIILSLFVLIGNPIIVMIIMGLMGYRKRTGFMAGLTVAQISEFSLIVMFMGNRIGHVSDQAISLITLVGAITFVASTYMIINNNSLYKLLSPLLDIFERSNIKEKRIQTEKLDDHIVLIGVRRMGEAVLEALKKDEENKIVAVDFDPDIVEKLKDEGIIAFYGDIADEEIQQHAQIESARLIISTISDLEDNIILLKFISKLSKKPKIVMLALEKEEARQLYKEGADYVILPHIAGGHHLAKILVEKNHIDLIQHYREKEKPQLS